MPQAFHAPSPVPNREPADPAIALRPQNPSRRPPRHQAPLGLLPAWVTSRETNGRTAPPGGVKSVVHRWRRKAYAFGCLGYKHMCEEL